MAGCNLVEVMYKGIGNGFVEVFRSGTGQNGAKPGLFCEEHRTLAFARGGTIIVHSAQIPPNEVSSDVFTLPPSDNVADGIARRGCSIYGPKGQPLIPQLSKLLLG